MPQDLDTIVHKAIDKDPKQRYASAEAMAEDLHRFIADEPIKARRTSATERLARWCRRNPMIAGLTAALAAVFLAGFAGVAWKWRDAERQKVIAQAAEQREADQHAVARQEAERATREAEHSRRLLYAADMNLACQAWDAGNTARARALLANHWPGDGHADLRGFEWYHLWGRCQDASTRTLRGHTSKVFGIHLSKDGHTLLSGDDHHRTCVWNLASQHHQAIIGPTLLALTPDGKTVALGHQEVLYVLNLADHRVTASFPLKEWPRCAAFSPGGDKVAVGLGEGSVHLFDLTTQRELPLEWAVRNRAPVARVAFSPDGRTLASGYADGMIELWSLDTDRMRLTLNGHTGWIGGLAFAPDGKTLVSASEDTSIRLWDTASGTHLHTWHLARTSLKSVAIASDGRRLAAGGEDGTIRMWDIQTQRAMGDLRGHTASVNGVAFAPDGQTLYSGSEDGTVKVWDIAPRRDPNLLTGTKSSVGAVAFSHGGKTLAVTDTMDSTVRLWDIDSQQWVPNRFKGHESITTGVSFSPNDRLLASTGYDKTLRLWDVATRRQIIAFPQDCWPRHCDFSPDGKLIAASPDSWGDTTIWDIGTRKSVQKVPGTVGHFSPDGTLLACFDNNTLHLWNTKTWEKQNSFAGFSSSVYNSAFARDGKTLAACGGNGTIWLWDVAGKREIAHHVGHTSAIYSVAFSPDGRRLATAGADSTVRLWDLPSLREVATLTGHDGPVSSVAFSPDGLTLASSSVDATVRLWQAIPSAQVQRRPAEVPGVPKPTDIAPFFTLDRQDKAKAIVAVTGQEYEVHVTAVDSVDWHLQLTQDIDVEEGGMYQVRFRARADVPRIIHLHAKRNGVPNWDNIGLEETVAVTPRWVPHEVRFQAKDIAAGNKISFNLGQQTGVVWIADFTVTKLKDVDRADPEIQGRLRRAQLERDTLLSLRLAAQQAWFGQDKELAATLERILANAMDTKDAATAERAAKACSLVPVASKAELEAALNLARKAVKLDAGGKIRDWAQLTLGMAEYRSGHNSAALEALDAATKAGPDNLPVTGTAAFYRAMTLFRQGKEDEARQVALAAAATMKPLPKDKKNPLDDGASQDDLILWLAYKEAKALVRFDEDAPADGQRDKK